MNPSMLIVFLALTAAEKPAAKVPAWMALLSNEKVQKELKLSDGQLKTIKDATTDVNKLEKALTAAQLKRVQEIGYQLRGGEILGDGEVAKIVGLTGKEQAAFKKAWEDSETKLKDFLSRARFRSAEAMRTYIAKHRKDATDAMVKQLSAAQKKKYTDLIGKSFDISGLSK